jgi:hypothetical protein
MRHLVVLAFVLFVALPYDAQLWLLGLILSLGDLGEGFVVGLGAGLVVAVLGVYNAGWNAHVDATERGAVERARDTARKERK